jgi:hypothetical protein
MNVLFVHAGHPHPKCLKAAKANAPMVKVINTGETIFSYWETISFHWQGTDDLLLIEQDIELPDGAIESFENCPEPWCSYRYSAPGVFDWGLSESLGCTRFRKEAQLAVSAAEIAGSTLTLWPGHAVPSTVGKIIWNRIDWRISTHLKANGFRVHVHGDARHYHPYPDIHVNEIVQNSIDAYLGKQGSLEAVRDALELAASGELNANRPTHPTGERPRLPDDVIPLIVESR